MQTQRDLTAERIEQLSRIDFGVAAARGRHQERPRPGTRMLAVFSDPDCPHCRTLEHALATARRRHALHLPLPLEGLHPGAREKAIAVWCAPTVPKAWSHLMLPAQRTAACFVQPPSRSASSHSARACVSRARRRFSLATAGELSVPSPQRSSTRGCAAARAHAEARAMSARDWISCAAALRRRLFGVGPGCQDELRLPGTEGVTCMSVPACTRRAAATHSPGSSRPALAHDPGATRPPAHLTRSPASRT